MNVLGYILGYKDEADLTVSAPPSQPVVSVKSEQGRSIPIVSDTLQYPDWLTEIDLETPTTDIPVGVVPETPTPLLIAQEDTPVDLGVTQTDDIAPDEAITLGQDLTNPSGHLKLSLDERRRHSYIVGKTGMGKSTLLEQMILADIAAGRGVALIDPHGDLYERVLAQIPKHRTNDVVLFDASDTQYPVGFNILDNSQHQLPSLIASSLVGVFKKIFGSSWGPRLEYILRNTTLTLLEHRDMTLLSLVYLLTDKSYRDTLVARTNNPFLVRFWRDEFDLMTPARQAEVVSPILNKVGQFLSIPLIRNIVSQPKSSFSPRWVMDQGKIFLANLSKGKIGEDVSEMLGSLLVTKFQLDAMSRADMELAERRDFFLYVDEFQNFATDSFVDIFSESRKYWLCLTLAHQYLGQLPLPVMEGIFGNVASIVAFQLGYQDARILSDMFGGNISATQLMQLEKYHFFARLTPTHEPQVLRGKGFAGAYMPSSRNSKISDKVRQVAREKFASEKNFVESKIAQVYFEDSSESESSGRYRKKKD